MNAAAFATDNMPAIFATPLVDMSDPALIQYITDRHSPRVTVSDTLKVSPTTHEDDTDCAPPTAESDPTDNALPPVIFALTERVDSISAA
jgi:hypothetical protein